MVERITLSFILVCAVFQSASHSHAASDYPSYLSRAQSLELELDKNPEKLKFRHNSTKVIRLWTLTLKKAKAGNQKQIALAGLAKAWARLSHWSGNSKDRAEAEKFRTRLSRGASVPRARTKTKRTRAPVAKAKGKPANRASKPKVSSPTIGGLPHRLPGLSLEMVEDQLHVVLPVSHKLSVKRHHIPARNQHGHRVYFDVSPLVAGHSALKTSMIEHASVHKLRVGQFDADTVRFVFDVEAKKSLPGVLEFRSENPPRFVLAIKRKPLVAKSVSSDQKALEKLVAELKREETNVTDRKRKPTISKPRKSSPKRKNTSHKKTKKVTKRKVIAKQTVKAMPKLSIAGLSSSTLRAIAPRSNSELTQIRRIVIDPGHGGKDHGATCAKKGKEKDVNLAIAKQLGRKLEKEMGVKIIYTRTKDKFVSLKRRAEIANKSRADLFISVHANAHSSAKVKGIETYYLNTTTNEYANRLARRENESGLKQEPIKGVKPGVGVAEDDDGRIPEGRVGRDMQLLLADLAMKSATGESRRLAGYVQSSVVGSLRKDYKGVRDLGVKRAVFYVLLGVRMPSILIESGFMSNPMEAKRLANSNYQSELAQAIAQGIKRFVWERRQLAQNL